MIYKKQFFILLLLLSIFLPPKAIAEFCCERNALFPPIVMPPEQEYDCTNFLRAHHFSTLWEGNFFTCPIYWGEYSWSGRKLLAWMVDEMSRVAGCASDPEAKKAMEKMLDADYIWKASLTLDSIEEEVHGVWEEGYYPDTMTYSDGYINGEWTLKLQLINIHFNEVVEQASIIMSGSCWGYGASAMDDMVRAYFNPIGTLVYEYEKIPTSCDIQVDEEHIEAGEETVITLHLKDAWEKSPKPWQRIVVSLKEGEILNGIRCDEDDGKAWAFKCDNGQVKVRYKAKEDCEEKTEIISVYNSCVWGDESVRPLHMTDEKELIGERSVKIVDLQPSSCSVKPEKQIIDPGENIAIRIFNFVESGGKDLRPEEKIMVKSKEGIILNGSPHGGYRIFPIGSGPIEVQYEAPDLCGLDKDILEVYNVCENREQGVIDPDKQIAVKSLNIKKVSCDLSVNIKSVFQWKVKRGNTQSEGNASMQIRGSMKFDNSIEMPFVKRYTPDKMTVVWSAKEKTINLSPNKDCPELTSEYSGGGSTGIPDPSLFANSFLQIHRFGDLFPEGMVIPIPEKAKSQMVDSFQMVLGGVLQTMKGKTRAGYSCGEDKCPCKEYKPSESKKTIGTIYIRGKMDKDGNMNGNHYWVAKGSSPSSIGFTVNEIGEQIEYKPRKLEKVDGESVMNVSVSWDIKAFR